MQKIKNFLFPSALMIILLASCMKKETYPVIPHIEYNDFVLLFDSNMHYPSQGIISISFTDGNGDIGLNKSQTYPPYDSAGPYYYNFIIDYYEKINGEFVKVVFPTISFNSRIPVLNSQAPGEAIKGIINETLQLNPAPLHDTIKFEAFIYDRALNKSNTISTPEIILRRP